MAEPGRVPGSFGIKIFGYRRPVGQLALIGARGNNDAGQEAILGRLDRRFENLFSDARGSLASRSRFRLFKGIWSTYVDFVR